MLPISPEERELRQTLYTLLTESIPEDENLSPDDIESQCKAILDYRREIIVSPYAGNRGQAGVDP